MLAPVNHDLTGFGLRIHPAGTKSFIVNYRAGDGGRKAPNKRVTIGRYGRVTVDQARKLAQNFLGQVAGGADPAYERAMARAVPTLGDTFEEYKAVNPNCSKRTDELYRYEANRYLGDWLTRPLDAISRRDVETRFNSITADHGWSPANRAVSLLRSVYRRPCVDHDGLRNPVDLWLAGGGKFHRKTRRKISTPAEVLPCWRAGIEAEVLNPAIRDALWFGLYTGMRREEVLTLRWERVDMEMLTLPSSAAVYCVAAQTPAITIAKTIRIWPMRSLVGVICCLPPNAGSAFGNGDRIPAESKKRKSPLSTLNYARIRIDEVDRKRAYERNV